jgi:hypothetical protein
MLRIVIAVKYFTHVKEYDRTLGGLPATPQNVRKINEFLHWIIKEANGTVRG